MSISSLITEGKELIDVGKNIVKAPLGQSLLYLESGISYALNTIKDKNWRYDLGYSFDIEGSTDFSPFNLQINPQDIQQSENFSISPIASQTGVVVEHQGFVMKSLTISGTTGINPVGSTRTGYSEFLNLRNYFRSYVEAKKSYENRNVRLIFRNKKDNEHWYVEPVGPGITLRRQAGRSFLYDYAITLMIVGKAGERKFVNKAFEDVLKQIDTVEDFIDNVADRMQVVADTINQSAKLLQRTSQQVVITLTNPVNKAAKILQAMKYAKTTISAVPRSFFEELKASAVNVRDNFIDLIGKGDSDYNTLYGRTPLPTTKSFVFSDVPTLEAVSNLVTITDGVLSSNIIFSPKAGSGIIPTTSSNIDDAIELNSTDSQVGKLGSNESLEKLFDGVLEFVQPNSIEEVIIQYEDTLEKIAYKHMGNQAHLWYQIVLLNNLDPPYLSETPISGKNTLKSGDKILIPQFGAPGNQNSLGKESKISKDLSIFEKNLGVDLQLTGTNDLAYDPTTLDLKLIAGINNAAQAIKIKLGLEKGALIYHPELGVSLKVGSKSSNTAQQIGDEIENTVLLDPRYKSITFIEVTRMNSAVTLYLEALLNNSNNPVPLQIDIK